MDIRKDATIRELLLALEAELERLRSRVGHAEVPQWEEKNRKEQDEELAVHWSEFLRLRRLLVYVQAKVARLGRQKGDRIKLTRGMIQRIKSNGRHNVAALAKELGVSRQTIYTILRKPRRRTEDRPGR